MHRPVEEMRRRRTDRLREAEAALADDRRTVAVQPMARLPGPDGVLAALARAAMRSRSRNDSARARDGRRWRDAGRASR
ncbi:MAG TPA: hypothetical protein VGC30_03315 [Dokdonella sp.]